MRLVLVAACLALCAAIPTNPAPVTQIFQEIFTAGSLGVSCYRIPLLLSLSDPNVILAFAEARFNSCSDSGPKGLALRRSTDAGKTWGEQTFIVQDEKTVSDGLNLGSATLDPSTGNVFVAYVECAHSCKFANEFVISSFDGGVTWNTPVNITAGLVASDVAMMAPGPGTGIDVNGRLLFCSWFRGTEGQNSTSVALFSDDNGKTWIVGGVVSTTADHVGNECQAAPGKASNVVLMNLRDSKRSGMRLMTRSTDGGKTFSQPWPVPSLPDPTCQGSFIRSGEHLLVSNAHNATARVNMTVSISDDQGQTFRPSVHVWSGPSAYSDLADAQCKAHVGLLFERGEKSTYETISFVDVCVN